MSNVYLNKVYDATDGAENALNKRIVSPLYNSNIKENISIEEINKELSKILLANTPSKGIILMHELGILKFIIPELENMVRLEQNHYHKFDAFYHTMAVLDKTSPKLTVRLAALLHDIGKFNTKTVTETGIHFYKHEFESARLSNIILERLKYSNDIINDVEIIISNHMRTKNYGNELNNVKDKTIIKLYKDLGNKLDDCLDLINADNLSHADEYNLPNQVSEIYKRIKSIQEKNTQIKNKLILPINGNDIIKEFNIISNYEIKNYLKIIKTYTLSNSFLTKSQALKIIKDNLK